MMVCSPSCSAALSMRRNSLSLPNLLHSLKQDDLLQRAATSTISRTVSANEKLSSFAFHWRKAEIV